MWCPVLWGLTLYVEPASFCFSIRFPLSNQLDTDSKKIICRSHIMLTIYLHSVFNSEKMKAS
jgi:hypothetical protein